MPRKEEESDWTEIVIGPSQKQRQIELQQSLQQSMERVGIEFKRQKDAKEAFNEQYGENLGNLSIAYAQRGQSHTGGSVNITGKMYQVEEIRSQYADELVKAISAQPEEERSEWLSGFFVNLDRIVPPHKK